jgi:hypothetical protein
MEQKNSQTLIIGCSEGCQKLECLGKDGVQAPKMAREKCVLNEKKSAHSIFLNPHD